MSHQFLVGLSTSIHSSLSTSIHSNCCTILSTVFSGLSKPRPTNQPLRVWGPVLTQTEQLRHPRHGTSPRRNGPSIQHACGRSEVPLRSPATCLHPEATGGRFNGNPSRDVLFLLCFFLKKKKKKKKKKQNSRTGDPKFAKDNLIISLRRDREMEEASERKTKSLSMRWR